MSDQILDLQTYDQGRANERAEIVRWLLGVGTMMMALGKTDEAKWAVDMSERIDQCQHYGD